MICDTRLVKPPIWRIAKSLQDECTAAFGIFDSVSCPAQLGHDLDCMTEPVAAQWKSLEESLLFIAPPTIGRVSKGWSADPIIRVKTLLFNLRHN